MTRGYSAVANDERDESIPLEATPFIRHTPASPSLPSSRRASIESSSVGGVAESALKLDDRLTPFQLRTILLLAAFITTLTLADEFIGPGLNRVLEAITCREYYSIKDATLIGADNVVPEELCKIGPIQTELATLRGMLETFKSLPSLLFAIPHGYLADRFGRRPIFFMMAISYWLQAAWIQIVCHHWQIFPVRYIWLSAIGGMFAGSGPITTALFYTVLADILPVSKRSTIFFRMTAPQLISGFVVAPIAGLLMKGSPWIPMLVGFGVQTIAPGIVYFLPETMAHRSKNASNDQINDSYSKPRSFKERLRSVYGSFLAAAAYLISNIRVMILVMMFQSGTVLSAALLVLPQYVSMKYALTLSNTVILLAAFRGLTIVIFIWILPILSRFVMNRYQTLPVHTDLILSRLSAVTLGIGLLALGVSPNLPTAVISLTVAVLGSGMLVFVRSVVTTLVESHRIARLYSVISVVETVGSVLSMPAITGLFAAGVNAGGVWVGLPFMFAAASMLGAGTMLGFVRLRKQDSSMGV